jgi:hypothetical protein
MAPTHLPQSGIHIVPAIGVCKSATEARADSHSRCGLDTVTSRHLAICVITVPCQAVCSLCEVMRVLCGRVGAVAVESKRSPTSRPILKRDGHPMVNRPLTRQH